MTKQGHLRLISLVFVLLTLAANLLLSACTSNAGGTGTGITPSSTQVTQPSIYNAPSWWNGQDCNKGNYPAAYDLLGYDNRGNPKTWRGIEVCGPLPGLKSTGPQEDFHSYGAGADQYMFQCTELVARYLWVVHGLKSQIADGGQIVDAYTGLQNSPFHKVVNDGLMQMFPVEGDVLSYGPTADNPHGHTSIVTDSNVTNGNGTINIIQQNIAWNGAAVPTETLQVNNWIIQPGTHGAGSVISWMTTRPVVSAQQPIGSATSTPTPTTVPAPAPTPTQPPTPTPTPPAPFTSGTWHGQGTYYNGQSPFDMLLTITVNGNAFSGTLEEDMYNSTVSISGTITNSTSNSVTISFTDDSTISGGQIHLNCTYTATIANGQMSGVWYYPGDSSPDGTITLTRAA